MTVKEFIEKWGAIVLVIAAFPTFTLFLDRFETVEAAEQKWNNHSQVIACSKVWDLQTKIALIRAELEESMTLEKRKVLEAKLDAFIKQIDKIDPKGNC